MIRKCAFLTFIRLLIFPPRLPGIPLLTMYLMERKWQD